jgi:hypothetical protein
MPITVSSFESVIESSAGEVAAVSESFAAVPFRPPLVSHRETEPRREGRMGAAPGINIAARFFWRWFVWFRAQFSHGKLLKIEKAAQCPFLRRKGEMIAGSSRQRFFAPMPRKSLIGLEVQK